MNLVCSPSRPATVDPIETASNWLREFGAVVLATVVSTWGSSPVPVGGQLVVAPDGRFEGSVSGGCVEIDVIAEARDIIAGGRPRLLEFGIGDEAAWRAGLPCGGSLSVIVEPFGASDAAHLEMIIEARRQRQPLAICTSIDSGERRFVDAGAVSQDELRVRIEAGESGIVTLDDSAVFLQVLNPPVRLIIAGATHITQVLVDLAHRIGYDAVVVDPRAAFVTAERFAGTPALIDRPETSFPMLGLDQRTAVVAVAHAAHLDDDALIAALRSDCLYVGALGSRKTHAKRLERLRAAGFAEEELARIHAPIGLNIGAKGPAEIALSILAEIVQVARAKRQ